MCGRVQRVCVRGEMKRVHVLHLCANAQTKLERPIFYRFVNEALRRLGLGDARIINHFLGAEVDAPGVPHRALTDHTYVWGASADYSAFAKHIYDEHRKRVGQKPGSVTAVTGLKPHSFQVIVTEGCEFTSQTREFYDMVFELLDPQGVFLTRDVNTERKWKADLGFAHPHFDAIQYALMTPDARFVLLDRIHESYAQRDTIPDEATLAVYGIAHPTRSFGPVRTGGTRCKTKSRARSLSSKPTSSQRHKHVRQRRSRSRARRHRV